MPYVYRPYRLIPPPHYPPPSNWCVAAIGCSTIELLPGQIHLRSSMKFISSLQFPDAMPLWTLSSWKCALFPSGHSVGLVWTGTPGALGLLEGSISNFAQLVDRVEGSGAHYAFIMYRRACIFTFIARDGRQPTVCPWKTPNVMYHAKKIFLFRGCVTDFLCERPPLMDQKVCALSTDRIPANYFKPSTFSNYYCVFLLPQRWLTNYFVCERPKSRIYLGFLSALNSELQYIFLKLPWLWGCVRHLMSHLQ